MSGAYEPREAGAIVGVTIGSGNGSTSVPRSSPVSGAGGRTIGIPNGALVASSSNTVGGGPLGGGAMVGGASTSPSTVAASSIVEPAAAATTVAPGSVDATSEGADVGPLVAGFLAIELDDAPRWDAVPRSGGGAAVTGVERRFGPRPVPVGIRASPLPPTVPADSSSSPWCDPAVSSPSPLADGSVEASTSGSIVPPARLLGLTLIQCRQRSRANAGNPHPSGSTTAPPVARAVATASPTRTVTVISRPRCDQATIDPP